MLKSCTYYAEEMNKKCIHIHLLQIDKKEIASKNFHQANTT